MSTGATLTEPLFDGQPVEFDAPNGDVVKGIVQAILDGVVLVEDGTPNGSFLVRLGDLRDARG